jgi:murein DD-endopeptidase MepM/ murein hydrolase activator NlpD
VSKRIYDPRLLIFFAVLIIVILACTNGDINPSQYEVRIATYDQIITYEEFLARLAFSLGPDEIPTPQINSPLSPADPGETIAVEGWGPKADGSEGGQVPTINLYKVTFDGCSPNITADDDPIASVDMTEFSFEWVINEVTLEAGDIIAARVEINNNEGPFSNLVYVGREYFTPIITSAPSSTFLYDFNLEGRGAVGYCYEIYVNDSFSAAVKAVELGPRAEADDPNWEYEGLRLGIGDNEITVRLQYSATVSATHTITIPIISLAWPVSPAEEPEEETITYYPWITSFHGQVRDTQHYGLDFDGVTGDNIHALADGTVYFSGYDRCSGNLVVLEHDHWVSYYLHLDTIDESIEEGGEVTQGAVIGTMGEPILSDCGYGDHLHLEAHYLTEEVRTHNENQKSSNPQQFSPPVVDFINLNPIQARGEPNDYINAEGGTFSLDLGVCANQLDFWDVEWANVQVHPDYVFQNQFRPYNEVLSNECIRGN